MPAWLFVSRAERVAPPAVRRAQDTTNSVLVGGKSLPRVQFHSFCSRVFFHKTSQGAWAAVHLRPRFPPLCTSTQTELAGSRESICARTPFAAPPPFLNCFDTKSYAPLCSRGGAGPRPAIRMADLLDMSLDQTSSRGSRVSKLGGSSSSAWQGGSRGREGGGMRSEVSRPQSSVVVSGGGTFRSAIASTTRAPSSGSGPMRRQGVARGAREMAAPYQRPTRGPESVFSRLGEREQAESKSLASRGVGGVGRFFCPKPLYQRPRREEGWIATASSAAFVFGRLLLNSLLYMRRTCFLVGLDPFFFGASPERRRSPPPLPARSWLPHEGHTQATVHIFPSPRYPCDAQRLL